jgi:hypothetical protein
MNELSTIIAAADRRYNLANATQLAVFTPSTQNASNSQIIIIATTFFAALTRSSKTTYSLDRHKYSRSPNYLPIFYAIS